MGHHPERVHSTNNRGTKQVPAVKSVYVFARESDPTAVCFDKNEKNNIKYGEIYLFVINVCSIRTYLFSLCDMVINMVN